MGNIFCSEKNPTTRDEYIKDIFDNLDKDNSDNLDFSELTILWDTYKNRKIDFFEKEIERYTTADSLKMINDLNFSKNILDLEEYIDLVNILNLSNNEIVELWKLSKN